MIPFFNARQSEVWESAMAAQRLTPKPVMAAASQQGSIINMEELSMNLGKVFSYFGAAFSEAASVLAGNEQAKAAGATTLQIIEADGAVAVKLLPPPISTAVSIGLDITEEVFALAEAIRGAHASVAAKVPAATGGAAVAAH